MIQMTPQYSTKLFSEVWTYEKDFIDDIKDSGLNKLSDDSLHILYRLLYARYGNSPIANEDENQFKAKVASVVFQYGPTWEKRVEVQDKIRDLKEDELRLGTRSVNNLALNPTQTATTHSLEEVLEITQQSSQGFQKSKLEGYALLLNLLETDVTEEFISKFKNCFLKFVVPQYPLWYYEIDSEEGE